jgi:hypothetical protein
MLEPHDRMQGPIQPRRHTMPPRDADEWGNPDGADDEAAD